MGSVIKTGVDGLVELVQARKKISVSDAAKELGVSPAIVEEWMNFLEEEGLVDVDYHFTKPYLVEKQLSPDQMQNKSKEFKSQKDAFIRKAESALAVLGREGDQLKDMKKGMGVFKIGDPGVKTDAKKLEKMHLAALESTKEMTAHEREFRTHLDKVSQEISEERKKYDTLISTIHDEEKKLDEERLESINLEKKELAVRAHLTAMIKEISQLRDLSQKDLDTISMSERKLDELRKRSKEYVSEVNQRKEKGIHLLEKQARHVRLKQVLEEKLFSRFRRKGHPTGQIEQFMDKREDVLNLVAEIDKEKDDLEKELHLLIKKAKAFEVSKGSASKGHLQDLETAFEKVKEKKEVLEREAVKLHSMFR